jgi:hypothetical protein
MVLSACERQAECSDYESAANHSVLGSLVGMAVNAANQRRLLYSKWLLSQLLCFVALLNKL